VPLEGQSVLLLPVSVVVAQQAGHGQPAARAAACAAVCAAGCIARERLSPHSATRPLHLGYVQSGASGPSAAAGLAVSTLLRWLSLPARRPGPPAAHPNLDRRPIRRSRPQRVNDKLVRELADAMVSSGLFAAGYNYLLVDDGWERQGCAGSAPGSANSCRDATGALIVDTAKFPAMGETVAYVHSKGLKFGLWFGHSMCSGSNDLISGSSHGDDWQQSLGTDVIDFAKLDAEMFAKWGVDAVKHDACGSVQNTSAAIAANYDRYMRLSQAINATGRPMLYDVVLQVDTAAGHGASLPHNNYGQVWTPEVYGGKEKMHAMANLWWSLPCNKYDCWECCVQGMTMQNSTASCTTDPEGRGEIPQSIQFINWLT
jgi:hypothetical protein